MTASRHAIAPAAPVRLSIEAAVATIAEFVRKSDARPDVEAAVRAMETYLDRPLKIGEIQRRLGVKSPTTIHKWVEMGRFPNARTVNRQLRVPARDVDAFQAMAAQSRARATVPPKAIEAFEGDPLEELL